MKKEKEEREKRKRKKEPKERKANWQEYTATVEDIQNFLMDRVLLRHNVITRRVEYRLPSSYDSACTDWQPVNDRMDQAVSATGPCTGRMLPEQDGEVLPSEGRAADSGVSGRAIVHFIVWLWALAHSTYESGTGHVVPLQWF